MLQIPETLNEKRKAITLRIELWSNQNEGIVNEHDLLKIQKMGFLDEYDLQNFQNIAALGRYGIQKAGEADPMIDCFRLIFGDPQSYDRSQRYIEIETPLAGDIVVYNDNDIPKHFGIYLGDGKVKSKWGTTGPVLIHHQFDVPTFYGNMIKFYRISPAAETSI